MLTRLRKNILRLLSGDKWEVRKTIWPYPEGYGVYHPGNRVILDTGLTKEQAERICTELNAKK